VSTFDAATIATLYLALHPQRSTAWGSKAWFVRELAERRGLKIHDTTLLKWLREGTPDERQVDVTLTLDELRDEAHAKVRANLDALEGIW